MSGAIVIRGARVHNLKNIDLEIPRERLVVITGVSGSGKSSLAFDTLYAEGQRRYLEALGGDARQLLQRLEQPEVDSIEGLSPAIAVQQRPGFANPRSTVGTLSDIQDFLRLLFARAGEVSCFTCGRVLVVRAVAQVVEELAALPPGSRLSILAPVSLPSAEPKQKLLEYARHGFTRVLVGGEMRELGDELELGDAQKVDLVIDRLTLRPGIETRLADSLEMAGRQGGRVVKIHVLGHSNEAPVRALLFSLDRVCPECATTMPEITPAFFSFNSAEGACRNCHGLGVVPQPTGRAKPAPSSAAVCPACGGARLGREARSVRIAGHDIVTIGSRPLASVLEFFSTLALPAEVRVIGERLVEQILRRLRVLTGLGLAYLTLDRPTPTLSAGELQRVRLAGQIGAGLSGVLYVLDEPSLGLHQHDNAKLLDLLRRLRDLGNTVLVVEHDRETMLAADYLIDMGPAAAVLGGEVVAQGTPDEVADTERSVTGGYLSGRARIPIPTVRRSGTGAFLTVQDAAERNLKNLTVSFPIGAMTCVTGVSGAGKSTLVMDVLYPRVAAVLRRSAERKAAASQISGAEHFTRVVGVDQAPIGRTSRSNPATYTGIYDHLRELFALLPEARMRGYGSERFSFNMPGGRCEACAGEGVARVDMQFLPELWVTCAVCRGRRYNRETLAIRYKGLSIADVLELTVDQALDLLGNLAPIHDRLRALREVGLGYLQIGQPAARLAGGEAQRVKLARELVRRSAGNTLYVLDEPTAGLHFEDVNLLLELLHRLTDLGNTIIVVEHNLEMIKNADLVIDLGPGGGPAGGELIASGTPEEIASVEHSLTGMYLRRMLRLEDAHSHPI